MIDLNVTRLELIEEQIAEMRESLVSAGFGNKGSALLNKISQTFKEAHQCYFFGPDTRALLDEAGYVKSKVETQSYEFETWQRKSQEGTEIVFAQKYRPRTFNKSLEYCLLEPGKSPEDFFKNVEQANIRASMGRNAAIFVFYGWGIPINLFTIMSPYTTILRDMRLGISSLELCTFGALLSVGLATAVYTLARIIHGGKDRREERLNDEKGVKFYTSNPFLALEEALLSAGTLEYICKTDSL